MGEPIRISGIQCDTPHCNYKDDSVKFEEYPDWINKRCPVCASNLLTQKDYDKCIILEKRLLKIIKIIRSLRWFNPMFYYNKLTGKKPITGHGEIKFNKK